MGTWVLLTQSQGEEKWVNLDRVEWFDRAKDGGTCMPLIGSEGHRQLRYFQESPQEIRRLMQQGEKR